MSASTEPRTAPAVVHAAGAVLWRERAGRLEVTLVHRPRYKDWSWPKGKLDPGESVAAAAVREVAEETGIDVVLGTPLPMLRYRTPDGTGKQVRYWAAREATAEDAPALAARVPVTPAPLTEIDEVVWVSAATAAELLTRRTDRRPLDVVLDLWTRGRLSTRVVAVARHAQARPRARWNRTEAERPLTPMGRAQADALVPLLAAFGVRRVVTSPWERCRSTVAPYAGRAGLATEGVDALTEAAHREDPTRAAATVAEHLGQPRDVVVATHRPVLPTVLATIEDATRRWTLGMLPAHDPYLRTGELLVAHVTGSGTGARVVAVEHHRPVRQPNVV
ncbi:MAG TPA: NUDIX domain-containing protein [Actinotalea sp.]|nr:NUDIX domain-containing protein [Actinotalea sp.]